MKLTPDFSDVSEDFEPLPVGDYTVQVDVVEPRTSKAGNPYLNWKLRVIEAAGEYAKYNNRILFMSTPIQGKGAFRLKDALKASGVTLQKGEDLETEILLGKQLVATVAHRPSEDGSKVQNDIKSVRAR